MPRKLTAASVIFAFLVSCAAPAYANPVYSHTESGSITIEENGGVYDIYSADRSIGAFTSFSNAAGETINSFQASADHTVLFRVVGGDPSSILGAFNANSRVFLVNPNGVLFGPGAQVNAPGLVASAIDISNDRFVARDYVFDGQTAGAVTNLGAIRGDAYVLLLGGAVRNDGTITSEGGTVALAAGGSARLLLDDAGLVSIEAASPVTAAPAGAADAVANSGVLSADGGAVLLTARAASGVFDNAINHSGVIEARSVGVENGVVTLGGGDAGIVRISGAIDVTGAEAGERGGTVTALGEKVGLFDGASIDASGDAGGGTVLVGGDLHGESAGAANARTVFAARDSVVRANALTSGDGGKVVFWADDVMNFTGAVESRGGAVGGDGGFVEISGHEGLAFSGAVDTRAFDGTYGTLLLDPKNIVINTTGTDSENGQNFLSNASGIVFIDNDSINSHISTNVDLQANNDIILSAGAPINIAASGIGLSMRAGRSVLLNSSITTNNGTVTIVANESTANGLQSANRDAGKAMMTMEDATEINAGMANITVTLGQGDGREGGDITLEKLTTTGHVLVQNLSTTGNNDILARSSDMLISGGSIALDATGTGSGDIGTETAPIRITAANMEARAGGSSAAGGIFIFATSSVVLGGANLGSLNGIFTGTGSIDIDSQGFLSNSELISSAKDVDLEAAGSLTISNVTGGADLLASRNVNLTVTGDDGTLTLASGAEINGINGNHTYMSDKMDLQGSVVATGHSVNLRSFQDGDAIDLGSITNLATDALELSDSELDSITADVIDVGHDGAGDVVLSQDLTQSGVDFVITGETIEDFDNAGASTFGDLELYADTGIGTTGRVDVEADILDAETDSGGIWLNTVDIANDGTDVSATALAGNVVIEGASGTALRTVSAVSYDGNVTITAAGALDVTLAASDLGVNGVNDVVISSTTGDVDLGVILSDDIVQVTSTTGDILLYGTTKAGNQATFTANNGSILDGNGELLDVTAPTLAFTAATTVGTASDPIEAVWTTLTSSNPNFIVPFKASETQTLAGLFITKGRITGGDDINDLTTSLYGEEDTGGEEEGEEDEEEAAGEAVLAATEAAPPIEEPPAQDAGPALETSTFAPCGV